MGGTEARYGEPLPETVERWRRRRRYADLFRVTLLVAWLAMAATFAVTGERQGDLRGLTDAIEHGRVTQVVVDGDGLAAGESGAAEQFVHWREGRGGWHRLYTRVEVTDETGEPVIERHDGEWRVQARDVGTYLGQLGPVKVGHRSLTYATTELAGWRVPDWLSGVVVGVQFLVLVLIVSGPEPGRATRWAWFWLFLIPVGAPFFLALSGPTPLVPEPRDPDRRLRGGWAFVISLVLGGIGTTTG